MSKASAITIGIVVTVFIGALVFLGLNGTDYSAYDSTAAGILAGDDKNGNIADKVRGPRDAKVFIVEYADFSCPMCGEANPLIDKYIEEEGGGEVALIFRNYPVIEGHPNSFAAASAALAAGFIKKPAATLADPEVAARIAAGYIDDTYYWEMVDTLFKNNSVWWTVGVDARNDTFVNLFKRIAPEASTDEFLSHMARSDVKQKINFDLGLGKHQGVTGTPSYFIDNQKLDVGNLAAIESVLIPAAKSKLAQ